MFYVYNCIYSNINQQIMMFLAEIDPFRFGGLLEIKSSNNHVEDIDVDWTGQIRNRSIQIKAKDSRV